MFERLYAWYGKRVVWSVAAVIVVLAGAAAYYGLSRDEALSTDDALSLPVVNVRRVADMNVRSGFSTVGTVRAVSEANLQTEAGGRVTSVPVELGQSVAAGTVIASLENAAQRAAVLQAEGAYEAAVAAAAASNVGTNEAQISLNAAKQGAVTAFGASYASASTIVRDSLDKIFSNPNSTVPGVRLGGTSYTESLNATRVELQTILPAWQAQSVSLDAKGDVKRALNDAERWNDLILELVDNAIAAINSENVSSTFTDEELSVLSQEFAGVRATLVAQQSALTGARTAIESAEESLSRAELSGTGGAVSGANAQVKIALGSLRSAQANLEKTLVRTPISGVVNALYLKEGAYVTPGQPAAIVANNNGLEIETSVSEDDRDKLTIGQEVQIDDAARGVITAIAGAVDPTTNKVSIKVSVADDSQLQNGTTVTITFPQDQQSTTADIVVPLSAIKMTGSGPIAFTVSESATLVPMTVKLGAIRGDSVVVTEGLAADTVIVEDARGLKEGQNVTVSNQ